MGGVVSEAAAVLDFWFLPAGAPGHDHYRPEWFRRDAHFDHIIRQGFGALVAEALADGLPRWQGDNAAGLARILLLDQFTRNLFRGTARAFAGDDAALTLAQQLIDSGQAAALAPMRRWFVFLPFEHSESLAHQERSVALFDELRRQAAAPAFESAYDYALRHREVIARYGRFPHRNLALGRASTPAEVAFLQQPGSSF